MRSISAALLSILPISLASSAADAATSEARAHMIGNKDAISLADLDHCVALEEQVIAEQQRYFGLGNFWSSRFGGCYSDDDEETWKYKAYVAVEIKPELGQTEDQLASAIENFVLAVGQPKFRPLPIERIIYQPLLTACFTDMPTSCDGSFHFNQSGPLKVTPSFQGAFRECSGGDGYTSDLPLSEKKARLGKVFGSDGTLLFAQMAERHPMDKYARWTCEIVPIFADGSVANTSTWGRRVDDLPIY